jgi:hypothetical protein
MGVSEERSVFEKANEVYWVNLLSRFVKIAFGLVMADKPPIRVVGLALKTPTRIKFPAKELPEAEPSALLELKPVLPKYAGK